MTRPEWQAAGEVDPRALGEARGQAQNAVHWLARLAHSYREPEPERRHVLLSFDAARRAFVTQPFADGVTVEVRLPALEMQFREGDRPVPHVLAVEGHSPAKVEAWVLVELLHRGIDRDRFSKTLPYDAHNLMTGDTVEYSPETCAKELDELAQWLGNAGAVLGQLGNAMSADGVTPGLVCWPEQFHVGMTIPVEPDGAVSDKALRVGLSAGDERYAEPYFFVAVQSRGEIETPHPGSVVTASRVVADKLTADDVVGMLRSAIATTRKRVSN